MSKTLTGKTEQEIEAKLLCVDAEIREVNFKIEAYRQTHPEAALYDDITLRSLFHQEEYLIIYESTLKEELEFLLDSSNAVFEWLTSN